MRLVDIDNNFGGRAGNISSSLFARSNISAGQVNINAKNDFSNLGAILLQLLMS